MNRFFSISFFIMFCGQAVAQVNQKDADGKKHGIWEQRYDNGELRYCGEFDHGIPVGTFERYYDDGSLQAVMEHRGAGETYATLYYPEEKVTMAEGKYVDQVRDSIWVFYSEEGVLASKDSYQNGQKEGLTEIYYADGSISEKIMFRDDLKNGLWEQYFNNGKLKLTANVVEGVMYQGQYTTYYPDGIKKTDGKYADGKKESSWYHFNEDGSVHIIYVYRGGKVEEEYPKNGTFETYWPNNIKRAEYTYKDGKLNGPFKEWYNMGEWKNEERTDEYGNRYPIQKLYGTQLERTGKYRDGELHREITTYDQDGSLKEKAMYDMGKMFD